MKKKNLYIVTGGTSGIGYAIGKEIFKNGNNNVILIGTNIKKINKINNQYKDKNILALKCDVTDENQVKKLFEDIKTKFGYVNGLVNCVGINPSRTSIDKTTLDDWNSTLETNITGYFLVSKYAIIQMKEKNSGSIVNISSVAANGMRNRIPYSSSKSAIIGFTKSLALDHAEENIRVNCICPAYIPTKLVQGYLDNLSKSKYKDLVNRHPMKRLGEPIDVANATLFFLSDKSKWITGNILYVDGGYNIN